MANIYHEHFDARYAETDDIKLSRIEKDLLAIRRDENTQIVFWVLGMWLLVLLIKTYSVHPVAILVLVPTIAFGGMIKIIYTDIVKKRRLLSAYGLQCENCGYLPDITCVEPIVHGKYCMRCHSKLDIHNAPKS